MPVRELPLIRRSGTRRPVHGQGGGLSALGAIDLQAVAIAAVASSAASLRASSNSPGADVGTGSDWPGLLLTVCVESAASALLSEAGSAGAGFGGTSDSGAFAMLWRRDSSG